MHNDHLFSLFLQLLQSENEYWIICHHNEVNFRNDCYSVCLILLQTEKMVMSLNEFYNFYFIKMDEYSIRRSVMAMNNFVEVSNSYKKWSHYFSRNEPAQNTRVLLVAFEISSKY